MERFNNLEKNIAGINETLYICYYASKHGSQFRKLIQNKEKHVSISSFDESGEEYDVDEHNVKD